MSYQMSSAIALLAVMALTPVQADEGVLEINAACVDTGCFSGDSGGYPVTANSAGSYRLTSDLVVPDADTTAIFTTDDVTLDLNGHTVRGPVTCTGTPVTSCSSTGTGDGISTGARNLIFDGHVKGFGDTGISAGTNTRISNVQVSHNGGDGVYSDKTAIHDSVISNNGGHGVSATAGGGNVEISRTFIRGNAENGVDMSSGLVIESRFLENGLAGLRSQSGSGTAAYALNSFQGNNGGGAQVEGGAAVGCNVEETAAVCP